MLQKLLFQSFKLILEKASQPSVYLDYKSSIDVLHCNILYFKNLLKLGHEFIIVHFDHISIGATGQSTFHVVAKLKDEFP